MAKRKGDVAEYTEQDRQRIIAHILCQVASGRSVASILRDDEGLCSNSEFWSWHFTDEDLKGDLVRARENGVEARLDRALEVANTPMIGEIKTVKFMKDGDKFVPVTEVRHEDMLGHRRLLVETEIKAAQMMKPKTYGPKLDVTSNNEKIGLAAELDAAVKREEERLRREGK